MYRRPDGLYEKVLTIDGERIPFRGKSERAVMQKIASFQGRKAKGILFAEAAEEYRLKHWAKIREETALRAYAAPYKRAVERFGNKRLPQIKPVDCTKYVRELEEYYAQNTVESHLSVLSQIFDFAIAEIRDCGIEVNPCANVRISPGLRKNSREPLTEQQRNEIKATGLDEFQLAPLILYTGCRLSEALALQWGDIDFERNEIHITKASHFHGNKPQIGELKTKLSNRTIPLLLPLRKRLSELRQGAPDEHYIIGGEQLLTLSALRRRWEQYCLAHGMARTETVPKDVSGYAQHRKTKVISITKIIPEIDRHQIRHEYATILFEAGIDPKTAQILLGHSQLSTTMDIYTHIKQHVITSAGEQLNTFFEK